MMIGNVLARFAIPGALHQTERFGSGLINDTYLCEFRSDREAGKYVLQRINTGVFRRPDEVMENIGLVTGHIRRKLAEGTAKSEFLTPDLVLTRDGKAYYVDSAGFWRVYRFIEDGVVFDRVRDRDHAFETGRALGGFQSLLSDLAPETLHDTLPGFHETPRYLEQFDIALREDRIGRAAALRHEIEFVEARRGLAPVLMNLVAGNEIPVRVVHNDPKVNNVMLHRATGKALCMLDLDTVKPGIVHFDFGDCARSVANPLGEDAPNLDSVRFDADLYRALEAGYLQETAGFLTGKEREMLPLSVRVITFELGLRFLTDYLEGDSYFRVRYPGHNLHRARVQFTLLSSIEETQSSSPGSGSGNADYSS